MSWSHRLLCARCILGGNGIGKFFSLNRALSLSLRYYTVRWQMFLPVVRFSMTYVEVAQGTLNKQLIFT